MKKLVILPLVAFLAACGEVPTTAPLTEADVPVSFDVVGSAQGLGQILLLEDDVTRGDLEAAVTAAGGTVEAFYPFGVAVASGGDFSAAVAGVASVVVDPGFQVAEPEFSGEAIAADYGYPPSSGDDDFFFDLQWGHNYVGAQDAWSEGYRGQGVRVAVLDGGFDVDHPDIAPNFNLALSADFTGEGLVYALPSTFSHGTHVAGTIAAADNAFGAIGVAPEAELIGVKVLSDGGAGSFVNVIAGIYYAAMVDADIMNLSLGTWVPRSQAARDISALAVAVGRAILWAKQQGTLVIVSAGNNAADLDGDGSVVRFLNGLPGTTGISAVAPLNWATYPTQALVPAFYTNYGTSMVDFAAPGGTWEYAYTDPTTLCTVAGVTRPCYVFDYVFSTGNGGWYWSSGTSMAAPHAAGVAALIISEHGSPMAPAAVEREMRSRAESMTRGRDDFFGHGLVNSGH